jgi:hypothetical protein
MRASWRAAVTVSVIATSSLIAACTPTPATDAGGQASQAATAWLARQYDATTHLIPSATTPGTSDLSNSAYGVASLAAHGYASNTRARAVTALAGNVNAFAQDSTGHDLPGSLARLILADVAEGGDPHSFGGTDLVARLEATMQTTGPDAGLFGSQDPTFDGAFRQGLSLAALSLVTPKPAAIDPGAGSLTSLPAVSWLLTEQCANGAWMPERTDLTKDCSADDNTVNNFAGPDTNTTALAILGLHAIGASATVNPLTWLDSIRDTDGGWSFDGSTFSTSDPDSTGLVMAAERALGHVPDAAAVSALLSFQFGASAPADEQGAFFYPPFSGPAVPNLLATNDALTGLAPGVWPAVITS